MLKVVTLLKGRDRYRSYGFIYSVVWVTYLEIFWGVVEG